MATISDSARDAARALLAIIRKVKSTEQLDKVLAELLAFVDGRRACMEEQREQLKRASAGAQGILSAPPPHPPHGRQRCAPLLVAAPDKDTGAVAAASSLAAHAAFVEETLLLCSVLAGAFGRRADGLITARSQATAKALSKLDLVFDLDGRGGGGVPGAASIGADRAARTQQRRAALRHFKTCTEQLAAALEALRAAAVATDDTTSTVEEPLTALSHGPGSRQRSVSGHGGSYGGVGHDHSQGTPCEGALTYGVGEVKDFAVHQRSRAMDRLRSLIGTASSARWNIESIVDAIYEISEFSPPTVAFSGAQSPAGGQRAGGAVGAATAGQPPALETTRVVTPLRDPLSRALIRLPCRGERCVHLDVFDAANFVRAAQRRAVTHPASTSDAGAACPICRLFLPLPSLRVDMVALAAVVRYKAEAEAESGPNASDPPATPAPPARAALTADSCLEWDMAGGVCRVVEGRRAAGHSGEGDVEEDEDGDGEGPGSADGGDGQGGARAKNSGEGAAIRKRRRVEIGGHVLFVDD